MYIEMHFSHFFYIGIVTYKDYLMYVILNCARLVLLVIKITKLNVYIEAVYLGKVTPSDKC